MDVETGTTETWATLSSRVITGDFDSYGNFYAAGKKSDLFVINPPNQSFHKIGVYAEDNILRVHVVGNYVYILVALATEDEDNPDVVICKHEILDDVGTLGERQIVLNWTETGDFAESQVFDFTFTKSGMMLVGTNNAYPIMIIDEEQNQDIMYKDILTNSTECMTAGNSNYIYMVISGEEWNLLRVDVGY